MSEDIRLKLMVPIAILMAGVIFAEALAINSLQKKLKQTTAEAGRQISTLERRAEIAESSARIDQALTAEANQKKAEAHAQFNKIKEASCNIDDESRLDDRLRELIADAYRIAVCTEADNIPMPASAGAGAH